MELNKDTELIKRLKARDQSALEEIIDQYGGLVASIVRYHLRGFEMYQEECINDVLLAVWNNIGQFNARKNTLKNWIGAISKYKSIDYKRKYYRQWQQEPLGEEVPDRSSENDILRQELEEEIESLLRFLPEKDRELFFDHYVLDKDINTLSNQMQMKPSVIYNRLSRGRQKIRAGVKRSEIHEK
jgi:RNA polymerase sigma-70 factor (ECF subfamily)